MTINFNFFSNRPHSTTSSTSSDAHTKASNAKSTQTPVHGSPSLPNKQEKKTSSLERQEHAAFLANSTMQWKINAALRNASATPSTQAGKNDQDIANALHIAAKENNAADIHDFAFSQLKNIPPNERLAWLRKLGADKAMHETMRKGSVKAIEAWGEVVRLLPGGSKFAFLNEKIKDSNTEDKSDHRNSIATRIARKVPGVSALASFIEKFKYITISVPHDSIATGIFTNTQPGAMEAWGKLLKLVPNKTKERSELLFARMDHEAGMPALAILFERGDKQALDQFVKLANKYVNLGDEDTHRVLLDCIPTLKKLAFEYQTMTGLEARDLGKRIDPKYVKANSLSPNSEEIVKAFGKLVQLAPKEYRNDIFFPEDIWTAFTGKAGHRSALTDKLGHLQARELAHSITMLKAMVPTMTAEGRKTVLNEIRSRHATKTMGIWKNTHNYKKFKKEHPEVDAMLLDLKAELKKA